AVSLTIFRNGTTPIATATFQLSPTPTVCHHVQTVTRAPCLLHSTRRWGARPARRNRLPSPLNKRVAGQDLSQRDLGAGSHCVPAHPSRPNALRSHRRKPQHRR